MRNDHVSCALYKLHPFRTIQNNRSDFLTRRSFGRSRLASRLFARRLRHVIERDGNGHDKQGQKEKKKRSYDGSRAHLLDIGQMRRIGNTDR
jgi:hypothetical protein